MGKNETNIGVFLNYLTIAFSLLTGLLLTPILVRYLGKNEYGLYQLMGSFIAYLSVLDLGFGTTITRYIARYNALSDKQGKENFLALTTAIYACLSLCVIIIGAILYFQIDRFFADSLTGIELIRAKKMAVMLVFSMAITIFGNLFTGALDGEEKFIFARLANIFKSFLNITLGIFIVVHGANSVDLTLLNVVLNILLFILLAFFSLSYSNIHIKYHYLDIPLLKEVFIFAFFIFLQSIMSILYWRIGGVILGSMVSSASVAVFSLAIQINHIFLYSTTAISSVLLPKASKLAATNATGKQNTDFMISPARYSLMIYALMLIGFVFTGKEFIQLWVGNGFENTYYIVVLIVLAGMIPRIQNTGNQLARAYNMQKFFTIMYFCMGLLNIVLTIVLVKVWGELGAAIGTVSALIIANTIGANFFYHKYLKINISRFFKETFSGIHWAIIAASFSGFFLNEFISTVSVLQNFIFKASIISTVYLFILFKLGLRPKEKNLLFKLFPISAK